jgi:hypothetical protein
MTCHEIENRLPAYREHLLSPEEQKGIAGHLASCPRCSRAFADLKKAEELVQGLVEVEPPPFFEQRIMSQVREVAGRKQGILRRLFYPLHIKIPLQALATLVVAVLAFHVYQQGGPEMKQMAPLPIPLTEQRKDQVEAESPMTLAAPPAVRPVKRAPAGDLPEMNRRRFVAPPVEKRGPREMIADSRTPMPEETPVAAKPAAPVMAAKEKDTSPAGKEALDKTRDRVGKQDSAKALETLLPEQKQKEKTADIGAAVGESGKMTFAPAPSRLAAATIKRSAMDLTIQVRDVGAALREIETRFAQVNARIIERQHRKESEFLKAEIATQNVAAFLDRLEAIGRVNLETSLPVVPDGTVTVDITIVRHP